MPYMREGRTDASIACIERLAVVVTGEGKLAAAAQRCTSSRGLRRFTIGRVRCCWPPGHAVVDVIDPDTINSEPSAVTGVITVPAPHVRILGWEDWA
jgi:hypothetical protein